MLLLTAPVVGLSVEAVDPKKVVAREPVVDVKSLVFLLCFLRDISRSAFLSSSTEIRLKMGSIGLFVASMESVVNC